MQHLGVQFPDNEAKIQIALTQVFDIRAANLTQISLFAHRHDRSQSIGRGVGCSSVFRQTPILLDLTHQRRLTDRAAARQLSLLTLGVLS